MKIITANNKKTIKMSKNEWQNIGRKAGWIDNYQSDEAPKDKNEFNWAKAMVIKRLKSGKPWEIAIHGYLSRLTPNEIDRFLSEKEEIIAEAKKEENTVTAKKKKWTKSTPYAICTKSIGKTEGTTNRSEWSDDAEERYKECKLKVEKKHKDK